MVDNKPTYWNIEDHIESSCILCASLDTDITERIEIENGINSKVLVLKCNYCGAANTKVNPVYDWEAWKQRRKVFRATHTINNIKRKDDMGNDIYEMVTAIKA